MAFSIAILVLKCGFLFFRCRFKVAKCNFCRRPSHSLSGGRPPLNQLVSALHSHCTIFIPFQFQVYLPLLRTHCEKHPQRNLRLSADVMLIRNMLAGSCAAGRSPLPAACLRFSLFSVGSPVCARLSCMASMLIRASTVNANALINVGWSFFFEADCPRGGWGMCKRSNRRPYASHQSR